MLRVESLAKVLPGVETIEEGLKIFTKLSLLLYGLGSNLGCCFYLQVWEFTETFTLKRRNE